MVFEERGERIDDLKLILGRVAEVATLFDDDGILVRFMNRHSPPLPFFSVRDSPARRLSPGKGSGVGVRACVRACMRACVYPVRTGTRNCRTCGMGCRCPS